MLQQDKIHKSSHAIYHYQLSTKSPPFIWST